MSFWGPLGVAIGLISLYKQSQAPNCPKCGKRVLFINNYCFNCHISWKRDELGL